MIYVVRHGETDWNQSNKVLGRTDIPLSSKGKSQAKDLATSLKDKNIRMIYTSPLGRAVETAQIISKEINANYEERDELVEQNFGIFEGVNRDDGEYQKAKREFFSKYPGGESYFDVVARVYPFIDKVKIQDENVLIVSHGGICRIICNYFNNMTNEEFATFVQGNCEVKIY